jgi:NADH:ubiquinone oxidoreductase subunit 6 (subunit J)
MTTIAILAILAILGGIATLSLSRKVSMTTIVADKLKRRLTTTSATTVITTLSFTLLLTFVTFVSLTQTSFAQTPNTNQTSTAQPKLITYPCKLTESTVQGPEYKAGAPFK